MVNVKNNWDLFCATQLRLSGYVSLTRRPPHALAKETRIPIGFLRLKSTQESAIYWGKTCQLWSPISVRGECQGRREWMCVWNTYSHNVSYLELQCITNSISAMVRRCMWRTGRTVMIWGCRLSVKQAFFFGPCSDLTFRESPCAKIARSVLFKCGNLHCYHPLPAAVGKVILRRPSLLNNFTMEWKQVTASKPSSTVSH